GNQNVTTSPARKSTMTKMTPPSKALTEADQEVKESPEKSSAPAEKPSEPLVVDDVDPTASNKTSVETLNDVLNENNSNNNADEVGMSYRTYKRKTRKICKNTAYTLYGQS
ncbi:hypothetical protein QTP86_014105, partial [Hemibagrus guttatus]